jgi:hypothetical protein
MMEVSYSTVGLVALVGFLGLVVLSVWLRKRRASWRLEGILPGGHVVEVNKKRERRVYHVEDGKMTRVFVFSESEWERGRSGKEIGDGEI